MNTIQMGCLFGVVLIASLSLYWYLLARDTVANNDPYGVIEAEEFGGQPERLVKCSRDPGCPEYPDALFWVAADIFSEHSTVSTEKTSDEVGSTDDMSAMDTDGEAHPYLEPWVDNSPPEYSFANPELKRGLELMQRAHDAGSTLASNELGLLHLEQDQVKDLELAERYFIAALENGDSNAAYNTARLKFIQNPRNRVEVLSFLELAAESGDPAFEVMYLLGLESFGNADEQSRATEALQDVGAQFQHLQYEFDIHFDQHAID